MPFRILIATDVFPPVCGGSGWSTYELARGLRSRGHEIVVVKAEREGGAAAAEYDGFRIVAFPARAPRVPFVRNYVRNERFYPRLAAFLGDIVARERVDLVHAQHVLTGPASVRAARAAAVPSVCTVRDYWPVCYWGDLIHDFDADDLCPRCSAPGMTRCLRARAVRTWPLAVPMIPYMQANLRMKRRDLSGADAVVAVSRRIAADLRSRAPELAGTRIETIPNPVDVSRLRAAVAQTGPPLDRPYALYVGKLARNKGVGCLV